MIEVDQKFIEAARRVVDYLWDDERKHFELSEDCEGHIFNALDILNDRLRRLERTAIERTELGQRS